MHLMINKIIESAKMSYLYTKTKRYICNLYKLVISNRKKAYIHLRFIEINL